jgi:nonsense-mediated mRNA decay protein 3
MVFCVECGKDVVSDEELRGGLCIECFLERNPLLVLPPVVDVIRCPSCGAIQGRGRWSDPDGTDPTDDMAIQQAAERGVEEALTVLDGAMLQAVDLAVRAEASTVFVVDVEAEVAFMGTVVPTHATTRVRVKGEQCDICSRRAGQYFEAVVQFRGTRDRPASDGELDRARSYIDQEVSRLSGASRDVFIMRVDELHRGLDFYISTHRAASQLAKGLASMFGASSSSTSTTVGMREGREVVRVTHAVRLPELRRGDFVLHQGQLLRVVASTSKEATVEAAAGVGRRRHLTRKQLSELKLVGDATSPEEAVLVSRTESEVQVLDPESFGTVDLKIPEGYDPEGRETVRIVRRGDELFLVE